MNKKGCESVVLLFKVFDTMTPTYHWWQLFYYYIIIIWIVEKVFLNLQCFNCYNFLSVIDINDINGVSISNIYETNILFFFYKLIL